MARAVLGQEKAEQVAVLNRVFSRGTRPRRVKVYTDLTREQLDEVVRLAFMRAPGIVEPGDSLQVIVDRQAGHGKFDLVFGSGERRPGERSRRYPRATSVQQWMFRFDPGQLDRLVDSAASEVIGALMAQVPTEDDTRAGRVVMWVSGETSGEKRYRCRVRQVEPGLPQGQVVGRSRRSAVVN